MEDVRGCKGRAKPSLQREQRIGHWLGSSRKLVAAQFHHLRPLISALMIAVKPGTTHGLGSQQRVSRLTSTLRTAFEKQDLLTLECYTSSAGTFTAITYMQHFKVLPLLSSQTQNCHLHRATAAYGKVASDLTTYPSRPSGRYCSFVLSGPHSHTSSSPSLCACRCSICRPQTGFQIDTSSDFRRFIPALYSEVYLSPTSSFSSASVPFQC